MDLVSAEAQLNALIEKRAGGERGAAAEREDMWRASVRLHRERVREQNRAAWVEHFSRMAVSHTKLGEDFRQRAESLRDRKETT